MFSTLYFSHLCLLLSSLSHFMTILVYPKHKVVLINLWVLFIYLSIGFFLIKDIENYEIDANALKIYFLNALFKKKIKKRKIVKKQKQKISM